MSTTIRLWDDSDTPPQPTPLGEYVADIKAEYHGTLSGYTMGCRCQHCKAANSDYNHLIRRGLRRCRQCGDTYPRGEGHKFCAACVTAGAYERRRMALPLSRRACARCSTVYKPSNRSPWDLCPACRKDPVFDAMKGAFGQHHAPIAVVLATMEWPYCANEQCGAWLFEKGHYRRPDRAMTRYTLNACIDHDHACCPGDRSCGACIRGIVCRPCNNAMPHTLNADRARGILDYLAAHANQG